jgi:hypothetical protein
MMRDCLKEFVYLWALTGEAYQREEETMESAEAKAADLKAFDEKFLELENRRYEQNAKIVSLMIYFPEREKISREFNAFLREYEQFNQDVRRTIRERFTQMSQPVEGAIPSPKGDKLKSDFEDSLMVLDQAYTSLAEHMRQRITETEIDNEKFM